MTENLPAAPVPTYVVLRRPPKSMGTAVTLTILFGALGLFYFGFASGVIGTIVVSGIAVSSLLAGMWWMIPILWVAVVVDAIVAVNNDRKTY